MDAKPSDPLDVLLHGDFSSPPDSPLRRGLLEKTVRQLRRRRLVHRCALAGTWAACFFAGGLTMLLWHASVSPDAGGNEPVAERPGSQEKLEPPKKIAKTNPMPAAVAKEWEAFDSTRNRAALFFEAGDRYFADN